MPAPARSDASRLNEAVPVLAGYVLHTQPRLVAEYTIGFARLRLGHWTERVASALWSKSDERWTLATQSVHEALDTNKQPVPADGSVLDTLTDLVLAHAMNHTVHHPYWETAFDSQAGIHTKPPTLRRSSVGSAASNALDSSGLDYESVLPVARVLAGRPTLMRRAISDAADACQTGDWPELDRRPLSVRWRDGSGQIEGVQWCIRDSVNSDFLGHLRPASDAVTNVVALWAVYEVVGDPRYLAGSMFRDSVIDEPEEIDTRPQIPSEYLLRAA